MNADVFSLAANAFSVVGLADVVFRSALVLLNLISGVVAAKAVAGSTKVVLNSFIVAITSVRAWAIEYEHSRFAQLDGQHVPDEVRNILIAARQEIQGLTELVQGVATAEGLWGTISTSLNFASTWENRFRDALPKLNLHTQSLILLMQSRAG